MSEVRLSLYLAPHFICWPVMYFSTDIHTMTCPAAGGSLKSSCVSLLVPLLLINNPGTHALVLRKVANTIRDSVYAQYL